MNLPKNNNLNNYITFQKHTDCIVESADTCIRE